MDEYLTKDRIAELKEELDKLKTERRPEVAKRLKRAKELGDLSENSEYQEAREDQSATEERIAKVESLIRSAEIVSRESGDSVSIGSKVTVKKDGGGESTYEIVGEEEADIVEKRISNRSPLGLAVMGKKKGDTVVVKAPGGEARYTILKVE